MGLSSSLHIGRTGLLASQVGLEVTGNNLANVATRGYHRQSAVLAPLSSQRIQSGTYLGKGVEIDRIVRHADEALEGRIRNSISDQAAAQAQHELLERVESIQHELTDIDLSTQLNSFFNSWSELANKPLDNSVRTVVTQEGLSLAAAIKDLHTNLVEQRSQTDDIIQDTVQTTNDLLTRIGQINIELVKTTQGSGGEHGLRDQRDALLTELSEFIDISTVEHQNGAVDIFVGSLPVLLNNTNRGVELRSQTVNGQPKVEVVISDDLSPLQSSSGRLGSLIVSRDQDVDNAIDVLNDFAGHLIFELNRIHSQGQPPTGFTTITGTTQVADPTQALNNTAAGLSFIPTHGSFEIHVTQTTTGQRNTSTINIDLDGINPASDTTLNSLVASLNAVANVSASVTPDGRLQIDSSSSDFTISFSDDSSGALAALGVNTFFSGKDAFDIQVNSVVLQNPAMLASAQGHVPGDNRTALAIADLRTQPIPAINGQSLTDFWDRHIQEYAVRTAQAQQRLDANTIVRENLDSQQQAVSGVNSDEEAVNLLIFQRAYQGSARFIGIIDELLQTLINLI